MYTPAHVPRTVKTVPDPVPSLFLSWGRVKPKRDVVQLHIVQQTVVQGTKQIAT